MTAYVILTTRLDENRLRLLVTRALCQVIV